jgi:hypothetical protein
VQSGVHFLLHRSGQTIVANHHDRVQVVGEGAVFFALSGSEK